MASVDRLVIEERSTRIGNFLVGRLLPFRKKRMVGPIIFLDHMGPADLKPPQWVDVDQHPHIGLCTFTYLLEGQMGHKDSTGADQIIYPGDVGIMTSGHGVTHTERTPQAVRSASGHRMHGYQFWIALPKNKEQMEPRFDYVPTDQVPEWEVDGMKLRLLAGNAYGKESPCPVHSPLFIIDAIALEDTTLDIHDQMEGEIAILVAKGKAYVGDEVITEGQLMVSDTANECLAGLAKGSRVIIFGGKPFDEERHIRWNFVSSSMDAIEDAIERWRRNDFPKVPNDDTYIPLP